MELPESAGPNDSFHLMIVAGTKLSRAPLGEGTSPNPIRDGNKFYIEPQQNASCARHAINAFLGGPVADDESFTAVNMATSAERLRMDEVVDRGDVDARHGNYPTQVRDYMDFLHDHGVSGFEPELHNIDLSGRAEDLPHELPDITGDRAIGRSSGPWPRSITSPSARTRPATGGSLTALAAPARRR
jgi:hypothetical protein